MGGLSEAILATVRNRMLDLAVSQQFPPARPQANPKRGRSDSKHKQRCTRWWVSWLKITNILSFHPISAATGSSWPVKGERRFSAPLTSQASQICSMSFLGGGREEEGGETGPPRAGLHKDEVSTFCFSKCWMQKGSVVQDSHPTVPFFFYMKVWKRQVLQRQE